LTQKDAEAFLPFIEGRVRWAAKTHKQANTRFLDPSQQKSAEEIVSGYADMKILWFGGYAESERKIAVIVPDYFDEDEVIDPIAILYLKWNDRFSRISHRDILGSLMGLGIVRENIGDIIVAGDYGYIFVVKELAGYILMNLTHIGRAPVEMKEVGIEQFKVPEQRVKRIQTTVPSQRLDAVLCHGLGVSRTKILPVILGGNVRVNWEEVYKPDFSIKEGDILSIKGKGRMKVESIGGTTKKGRIPIVLVRYL